MINQILNKKKIKKIIKNKIPQIVRKIIKMYFFKVSIYLLDLIIKTFIKYLYL